MPEEDYMLPLGKAEVVKEGKDVTVVGYGSQLYPLESAIRQVEAKMKGVSIELIDLRSILPFDAATIIKAICILNRFLS